MRADVARGPVQDWVTIAGTTHVLRAVAACGGDADALAARFDIPRVDDCSRRIAVDTMIELWEAAIEITGRRELAAVAQTRERSEECSLLGFAATNQRTMSDAIAILARYGRAFSDCYCWHVLDDGERIALRTEPIGPIDRVGWQAYQEFQLFDVVAIARRLAPQLAPLRVAFVHPRPLDAGELDTCAGVATEFGAAVQEVVYPSSIRELAIEEARPHLARMCEDRLQAIVEEIGADVSMVVRAKAVVGRLVLEGTADVSDLARELAMSRRSLERALHHEGVSAAALFDAERRRLALLWLPRHSVDEVARRVGYANTPAFSRAFRRWTGLPPSAFRITRAARVA
jgi:AraC-like DNA-binding protein